MKILKNDYYGMADGDLNVALILAIEIKDVEAVRVLIPLQRNINQIDDSELSWTPLIYAVAEESLDMVQLLVEAGADVNIKGLDPDEFALNIAASGCLDNDFLKNHIYKRNQEIFDYLYPLTSPELQKIAQQTKKGESL